MPEILLGVNARNRRTAWTPIIRVVNYLAEKNETNLFKGVSHIQRPGLTAFATVGAGPIRGVFRQAGTFSGDFLVASGTQWFRVDGAGVSTLLDTLPGTQRTSTAATASRAITVSNNAAWSTNGTTVTQIVMPDSRSVGSVAQLNGYFILTDLNSARFYWIEPGETNPDGLSFASTESVPGVNVKVERVGDELWFFKEEGMEVWVPTGDADLPFQRVGGRNYDKGCRNRDTVVRFDNTVAWVGNDAIVYLGDASPVRISDHAIEEQIRKSDEDSLRAWSFDTDGHRLYCLTMEQGTWVFDRSAGVWTEFQSYGRSAWRAHVGDEGETFVVAGDDEEGVLYRIDPQASNDNGEPLERILTGGVALAAGGQRCDTVSLYVSTGTAEDPTLYPKVRVRWSDDMETYGSWLDVSLGRQGQYGQPVQINRLGMMRYPGRLFEFSITSDVVATIHGASFNERAR